MLEFLPIKKDNTRANISPHSPHSALRWVGHPSFSLVSITTNNKQMKVEEILGKEQVQAIVKHLPQKPLLTDTVKVRTRFRTVDYEAIFDLIGVEGKTANQIWREIQRQGLPMPPSKEAMQVALRKAGYITRDGIGSGAVGGINYEAEYIRRGHRTMISHTSGVLFSGTSDS